MGLGSVCLHSTLTAWGQSLDEVPMLWVATAYLFAFVEAASLPGFPKFKFLPWIFLAFVVSQTLFYYVFRHLYIVFLVSYVSLVIIIIVWTGRLAFSKHRSPLRMWLWTRAIASYVLIGIVLWVYEMWNCERLLPFFNSYLGGVTFHVLWHFGAGIGTYLMILQVLKNSSF